MIYDGEDVTFYLSTDQSDCADSSFCDTHRKHIITGDLRIIKKKTNQQNSGACHLIYMSFGSSLGKVWLCQVSSLQDIYDRF